MSGIRLESRVHIVTGANNAIENIVNVKKNVEEVSKNWY
ncbi:MAG: hypothetical protein CM15mP93_00830 [Thiotrichaceae bacterium]|nr:MAG: hypothetical protein CM15mP93_00830 [Thiotrichaceae bacterium]